MEGFTEIIQKESREVLDLFDTLKENSNNAQKECIKDIQRTVDKAGITCDEPSFEDFMAKAIEHMKRADDMYYDVVMLKDNGKIDTEKECQTALDKAINVLQQAKKFSELVGF